MGEAVIMNHPNIVRFGADDSAMEPELIKRMEYGCAFVDDMLQEKGPPPDGDWFVFEVRPCKVVNGIVDHERCVYDYAYSEHFAVQAPSGEYVFVALFNGDRLMKVMRAEGCDKEATYINETRHGAPLVVVGYGATKGMSVRGLGFVQMQPGGSA